MAPGLVGRRFLSSPTPLHPTFIRVGAAAMVSFSRVRCDSVRRPTRDCGNGVPREFRLLEPVTVFTFPLASPSCEEMNAMTPG